MLVSYCLVIRIYVQTYAMHLLAWCKHESFWLDILNIELGSYTDLYML